MNLYVKTFGCQMNVHDSARLEEILASGGCGAVVGDPREASVAVINSCSVREKAWHKAVSEAGRLCKLKGSRSDLTVVFAGCVAQQEGERLFDLVPGIDIVVSPDNYRALPALLEAVRRGERSQCLTGFDRGRSEDFHSARVRPGCVSPTAYVTVMKGCDERCAYCIVPSVRGPERFRPGDDIEHEVRRLVASGVKEVTLLGQRVNSYRHGGSSLADLLDRLDRVEGLERTRFTAPHPALMDDALVSRFGRLETLCEAIHLPAQSGDDGVLERMGRAYTADEYVAAVEKLRGACPGIAVTTDLIVGFPGETDRAFERTLDLVDRAGLCGAFSFKYSPRPGTAAADLPDDVPPEEKARRLSRLHDTIDERGAAWRARFPGSRVEVLVEGRGRREGQLSGRSRDNLVVNFVAGSGVSLDEAKGCFFDVEITRAHPHSLEGVSEL